MYQHNSGGTLPKNVAAEHILGGGYLYRPDQLLVFEGDLDVVLDELKQRGLTILEVCNGYGSTKHLQLQEGAKIPALVDELRGVQVGSCKGAPCSGDHDCESRALRVAPNHVLAACGHSMPMPGGPPRPDQHARLAALKPPIIESGPPVRVLVLDSGIVEHHSWFGPRVPKPLDNRYERPGSGGTLLPFDGHGTFIAGIVLENAPVVDLHVASAFDGTGVTDDLQVAGLIDDYAGDADIVVLSFGGHTADDRPSDPISEAIGRALHGDNPPVFVAAAGNQGTSRPVFPAACKGVIAVAATDAEGNRAGFSNHGPWVDAGAPGVDVLSTFFDGHLQPAPWNGQAQPPHKFTGFARWSGTSFAAPLIAADIAAAMGSNGLLAAEAAYRVVREAASPQSIFEL